jgi:hypothetical protein
MIKDVENTELEERSKSDNWRSPDSFAYFRVIMSKFS